MSRPLASKRVTFVPAASALLLALSACATVGVREGGINIISVDDEWRMRDEMRREVERKYTVVHDGAAEAYLNRLGRSLAARTALGQRQWDFGIVRADTINAFNLPGGLVYVHTGLIDRASRLDQFTGVLSHEVAHGSARHGTQLMTRALGLSVVASVVLGRDPGAMERIAAQVVGTGILSNYGRDAEREADRLGIGYMYEAGYDPRGMPDFFRVLLEERNRRPSGIEQFFSTHPVTEERIETTEAQIARLPRRNLVRDTPDYQGFRQRFRR
jgi:predicted Zn-dependent protease